MKLHNPKAPFSTFELARLMTALHSDEYKRFSRLLARIRTDLGVSQYELARRLGVDQTYISKYESARRRLDVIEFLRVTAALKIDPSAVFEALSRPDPSDQG